LGGSGRASGRGCGGRRGGETVLRRRGNRLLVWLDLAPEDAFFAQIYAALRRVGWGRTTTYGALAKEVGAGREAARDVSEAMARNPAPLIIPCHRVLAAGGRIGGFSAPGGSRTKIRMLELEGVRIGPPAPAQQSFSF
jgi:methylated-DNA-[protein]-cysteine S-methyltransferase